MNTKTNILFYGENELYRRIMMHKELLLIQDEDQLLLAIDQIFVYNDIQYSYLIRKLGFENTLIYHTHAH